MLKEIWEVHVIGTNENDLFEAIITAEDCSKLIAQVAKVETANDIVSLHNNERGLTPRAADGACTCAKPSWVHDDGNTFYCSLCGKSPRR